MTAKYQVRHKSQRALRTVARIIAENKKVKDNTGTNEAEEAAVTTTTTAPTGGGGEQGRGVTGGRGQ
eukprot:1448699-Ditylum_brightwellii.AAC.1